jgi:integrase
MRVYIEWSDIDLVDKRITIRKGVAKTAMRRSIPISDNLLEWLIPYAGQTGNVWKGSHNGYYDTQQATSIKAGVDWVHNGLRHSYGSYRFAQLQGDAGKLAGEMGNTPAVLFKHYRELVKPADAVKWFNVKPGTPANVVTLAASHC